MKKEIFVSAKDPKRKRTKKQYLAFQKAFGAWRRKWLRKIFEIKFDSDTIYLFGEDYHYLTDYTAPGYIKYMKYQFRNFKKSK